MNFSNPFAQSNGVYGDTNNYVGHHNFAYTTRTNKFQRMKELIATSTHPVPIFTINYLRKCIKDPARKALEEKKYHEKRKRLLKLRLRKEKCPQGYISDNMKKFIEMMETDPDPLISTEYNWHLNGGSLECVKIDGNDMLVQPSMNEKYSLRLLDTNNSGVEHIVMNFKPKYHERVTIYETMKSSKYIGIRKPKSVNLSLLERLGDCKDYLKVPLKFSWSTEIAGSTLYDDKLFFIDTKNKLVISSVDQLITSDVIDLKSDSMVQHFPVSIDVVGNNVISYTNLMSLNLLDTRSHKPMSIFDSSNFLMKCEELTYHRNSLHDNLLYLASSHMLYGIDIRNTKAMVIHWTHQMTTQPTMLKTVKMNDDEVICLSSNIPGDLKIFNCDKGSRDNSWIVNQLPLRPHTISDSYIKLREMGKFLLSESIQNRLKLNITGISMIPNKNHVELFIQNSLNDVFKSQLVCHDETKFEEKRLKKAFKLWDEILEIETDPFRSGSLKTKLESQELLITDIVNLKGLAKVLQSDKFQKDPDPPADDQMNTKKAPRWRTNLEDEQEYRDALAQHIFAEWDLDIADFKPHPFADALKESDLRKDAAEDKVTRWLTKNSVDAGEPEKEVDMPLQEIYSQTENIFTQTTIIATQKTDVSKKPKRIKGF